MGHYYSEPYGGYSDSYSSRGYDYEYEEQELDDELSGRMSAILIIVLSVFLIAGSYALNYYGYSITLSGTSALTQHETFDESQILTSIQSLMNLLEKVASIQISDIEQLRSKVELKFTESGDKRSLLRLITGTEGKIENLERSLNVDESKLIDRNG